MEALEVLGVEEVLKDNIIVEEAVEVMAVMAQQLLGLLEEQDKEELQKLSKKILVLYMPVVAELGLVIMIFMKKAMDMVGNHIQVLVVPVEVVLVVVCAKQQAVVQPILVAEEVVDVQTIPHYNMEVQAVPASV